MMRVYRDDRCGSFDVRRYRYAATVKNGDKGCDGSVFDGFQCCVLRMFSWLCVFFFWPVCRV